MEAASHDPIAAFRAAADPRDRGFVDYWSSRIDLSDPAAPHWMAHFNQRGVECRKMADAIEQFAPLADARVLDVGCQTGALAVVMAERGARVTGIDTEDWVLEAGRRRAGGWNVAAEFRVARGESLPWSDAEFDVVTFVDVIEHCDDSIQCLREMSRVLRPGGIAYVLGPNRFAPQWFVSDPHYRLAGASVLSRGLGRRYVEWRRGRTGYDVGEFPIGSTVARTLRESGLDVLQSPATEAQTRWQCNAPSALKSWTWVASIWGAARMVLVPTFVIVARRQEM